ncbi:hypothetical protein MRX96_042275 [Rhipicephalus microplus]
MKREEAADTSRRDRDREKQGKSREEKITTWGRIKEIACPNPPVVWRAAESRGTCPAYGIGAGCDLASTGSWPHGTARAPSYTGASARLLASEMSRLQRRAQSCSFRSPLGTVACGVRTCLPRGGVLKLLPRWLKLLGWLQRRAGSRDDKTMSNGGRRLARPAMSRGCPVYNQGATRDSSRHACSNCDGEVHVHPRVIVAPMATRGDAHFKEPRG